MYSDRTLLPKECLRLCALGTLALSDKPISYADLANSVRHFTAHIMGPSLDMMGSSLQLLKLEGLVREDCKLELDRVLALREDHADEAAPFTGWLDMEARRLEQKRDWLKSLLD